MTFSILRILFVLDCWAIYQHFAKVCTAWLGWELVRSISAHFFSHRSSRNIPSCMSEYDRPISAMNNKTCTSSHRKRGKEQSRVLDNITKTFMIRRLARDTLKKMLPPRTEVLVFCRPAKVQCQLYRKMARAGTPTSDALTTLISLRKLCSHPSLVDDDAGSSSATNTSFLDSSGKLKTLNMLLTQIRKDAPRDKVVIVSNFTTALSTIEDAILKPNGYTFVRLDGTTELSNRQQLVDTFNKTSPERSFVFLLSSKAGGCGLNLIGGKNMYLWSRSRFVSHAYWKYQGC